MIDKIGLATPDQDTIDGLKQALALAEKGKLRSFAMVGELRGGATYTHFETHDIDYLIGAVSFLHHMLCARKRELPAPLDGERDT